MRFAEIDTARADPWIRIPNKTPVVYVVDFDCVANVNERIIEGIANWLSEHSVAPRIQHTHIHIPVATDIAFLRHRKFTAACINARAVTARNARNFRTPSFPRAVLLRVVIHRRTRPRLRNTLTS